MRAEEAPLTVSDTYKWSAENLLLKAFGGGTAAVVLGPGIFGH